MDAHSSREEAKNQSDTDEEWDWYKTTFNYNKFLITY